VVGAVVMASEERRLWTSAGARGLSLLTAHLPGDYFLGSLRVNFNQPSCVCALAGVACVVCVLCLGCL